jgi:serine phosphatase RsbU (regulator of sigma subunit)
LLVDPQEQVIASSIPDRYPISSTIPALLPDELDILRGALAGTSNGELKETPQGTIASVAQTVWSRDEQPIGAILIQTPGRIATNTTLIESVTRFLLPTALGWLCLMLPVGLFFGVLTTHGLILRIERLARASERYARGDLDQRVPVQRPDEVGQLEHQFNRMAEQLVSNFAERQAQAEESARREERARIEQELASAHYIQQSLLPVELPIVPGWEIKRHYQPARQVGGDLYDFLDLSDGKIGIVIGDATGKGMSAALIMATTCAMLRAAAPSSQSPGKALALVNDLLQVHIPPATFVTCFYAVLEPSNGRLTFANAGHSLPYRARNGVVAELRAAGLPLGLMPDQDYVEGEVFLSPGDNILLHTDGLVEAHDPQGEMFGAPRLAGLLPRLASDREMIPSLLAALTDFTGPGWEQEDDVTLILLQHKPGEPLDEQ